MVNVFFAYDRSFRPSGHDDLNNLSPQDILDIFFLKTVQIKISWLMKKPTDESPHCSFCTVCGSIQINGLIKNRAWARNYEFIELKFTPQDNGKIYIYIYGNP